MKKLSVAALALVLAAAVSLTAFMANRDHQVKIVWLHHYQEATLQKWCEDLAADFEAENPNVDVVIERVGSDDYLQMLKAKIAADDPPMLFDLDNNLIIKQFVDAGHVYNLSDCDFWKSVDDVLNCETVVDGKHYGSVMSQCSNNCFYNKTLFEEYGLEVPETREAYIALCDKLMELGIQPISAAFGERWCLVDDFKAYYLNYCWKDDANWYVDKADGNTTFSEDECFKKAFSEFMSMKKYWGENPFKTSYDDACAAVAAGKAAMINSGSWALSVLESMNPDVEYGTFAVPLEDLSPSYYVLRPGGCQVVYNTEDTDKLCAALKFMEYMFTIEAGESFAKDVAQISAINGVAYDFDRCLEEIVNADHKWFIGGKPQWSDEHDSMFYKLVYEYASQDNTDADMLAAALDSAFISLI